MCQYFAHPMFVMYIVWLYYRLATYSTGSAHASYVTDHFKQYLNKIHSQNHMSTHSCMYIQSWLPLYKFFGVLWRNSLKHDYHLQVINMYEVHCLSRLNQRSHTKVCELHVPGPCVPLESIAVCVTLVKSSIVCTSDYGHSKVNKVC